MASRIPVSPSAQMIRMSFTPRFLRPFNTDSQYLELSFSPTSMVRTSFLPSCDLGVGPDLPARAHRQVEDRGINATIGALDDEGNLVTLSSGSTQLLVPTIAALYFLKIVL